MRIDISRQDRLARIDNNRRQHTVKLGRQLLFEQGKQPNSKAVSNILGPQSLTPNQVHSNFSSQVTLCIYDFSQQNAFSESLGPHGFDFHLMFVVDLLHEFELGVWKAIFTHLLRILYTQSGDVIAILNER